MNGKPFAFGSLFTGSGAFDLGLERAGLRCRWQVEKDPACRVVLDDEWPGLHRPDDATAFARGDLEGLHVDVICGGDPCPKRSRVGRIHGSDSPDLWPEFLRIVSALRPLWVLREHVVSPDADECAGMLADLGYSVVLVEMDGAQITGQSRPREFLCGVLAAAGICPLRVFSQREGDPGRPEAIEEAGPVAACLTTDPQRFDACDNYVLEPGRGLRILDAVERERLQGLPDGWTGRLSFAGRARLTGNALIVHQAEWLGRRLTEHHAGDANG